MHKCIDDIKDNSSDCCAQCSRNRINHGNTFALGIGTECGKHDGNRCTDRNTQQKRESFLKLHGACDRESLYDTDGCGSRLQEGRKEHTYKDTQDRIGQGCQYTCEPGLILQSADCAAHGTHTDHQDDKAHQNISDVLGGVLFTDGAEQDADDGNNACQSGG